MSLKTDRVLLLRRLTLLVLAVVLTSLALTPSLMAAACTNGSTQTIFTSIACCTDPPTIPTRPVAHQKCVNGQWVTTSTGCQRSPNCAF